MIVVISYVWHKPVSQHFLMYKEHALSCHIVQSAGTPNWFLKSNRCINRWLHWIDLFIRVLVLSDTNFTSIGSMVPEREICKDLIFTQDWNCMKAQLYGLSTYAICCEQSQNSSCTVHTVTNPDFLQGQKWTEALSVMTTERRDSISRKFCWASCSVCKPLSSSSSWRVTSTSVVVSSVATEVNPREWVPLVVTAWATFLTTSAHAIHMEIMKVFLKQDLSDMSLAHNMSMVADTDGWALRRKIHIWNSCPEDLSNNCVSQHHTCALGLPTPRQEPLYTDWPQVWNGCARL